MSASDSKRLWVGNLHPSVTEGDLITFFSAIGKIYQINFLWHHTGPKRGLPRGYAFIEFFNSEDAKKSILLLNHRLLRGRKVIIKHSTESTVGSTESSIKHTSQNEINDKKRKSETILDSDSDRNIELRKRSQIDSQIMKIQELLEGATPSTKKIREREREKEVENERERGGEGDRERKREKEGGRKREIDKVEGRNGREREGERESEEGDREREIEKKGGREIQRERERERGEREKERDEKKENKGEREDER